jgi:T5SS/PEP-CTERM-associated repeat protein
LGLGATGRGTVTIDGAGSRLFGTDDVSIAVLGTSAVTLTNGGAFQAANLYLGNNTGAQTGTLNVRSASQATLTNLLIAGNHANGIVNVDGPTSLLTSKGGYIGYGGIGTVNLTNGGSLQLRRR